jgi:hypothetical protein
LWEAVTVPSRHFRGPKDYLDLARSPDATPDELRTLAQSEYPFVRLAVAEHPATPTDALDAIVPDTAEAWREQDTLLALARHPAASNRVLTALAALVLALLHERDIQLAFAAGVALYEREDTPGDVLLGLLTTQAPRPSSVRWSPAKPLTPW